MTKKNYKTIELDPKYVPKQKEEYMCPEQLAYFYNLLLANKEELLDKNEVLSSVRLAEKNDTAGVGDDLDVSTFEQEIAMNLKLSQRKENLIKKIDTALERIEAGTFGYSVVSGEEIGLKRMLARPLATVTIEEQEEIEKSER